MEKDIFAFFGQALVYAGGSTAVAVFIFKWLGKSYIDHKFSARLDELRHDQNVIVARLKVEIDSMLNGALKFQERDFTVLPVIWESLDKAFVNVTAYASPMQWEQDVSRLNEIELAEFLEDTKFMEFQKQQILKAGPNERQSHWTKTNFLYWTASVKRVLGDYQKCVGSNAIFLSVDLKDRLAEMEKTLWGSIKSVEIGTQAKDFKLRGQGAKIMEENAKPLRDEIEQLIQTKLASHLKYMTSNSLEIKAEDIPGRQ